MVNYDPLGEYRKEHPLGKRGRRNKKIYEGLEEIADEGRLTLKEIGKFYGNVSRERARQILVRDRLHDKWKMGRMTYSERRKDALTKLAETLYTFALEKAEGDKALQRALESYITGNRRSVTLDSLVKLFKVYYAAKESGKKLSLEKLGEESGIATVPVGRILKEAGEEALHGAHKIKRLTKKEIEFVEKAIKSSARLSYSAMAKITKDSTSWEIPYHLFAFYASKNKVKRDLPMVVTSEFAEGTVPLSSSIALFEALDAGFSEKEAMEYADIRTPRAFEAVVSKRKKIEEEVDKFKADTDLKDNKR
jgi:hypothetical protein